MGRSNGGGGGFTEVLLHKGQSHGSGRSHRSVFVQGYTTGLLGKGKGLLSQK